MVRTNLRVEVVIETIEGYELVVAEVAFVPLALPCRLVGGEPDNRRARSVPEDGIERDSIVGVTGPYQIVHHVPVHIGKYGTGGTLEVLSDCTRIAVGIGTEGTLFGTAAVSVRVQMLR